MADLIDASAMLRPESDRRCFACGHAVPHDSTEYEDTHSRCSHTTKTPHHCDKHKRFNKRCAADIENIQSCWTRTDSCYCSEEDRVIADLKHKIAMMTSVIADLMNQIETLKGGMTSA